jgi:hypothetical protein
MLIKFENKAEKNQYVKNLLNLALSLDAGSPKFRESQQFIAKLSEVKVEYPEE